LKEPYEDELKLIATLTQYCLRFDGGANAGYEPQSAEVTATNNGLLAVPGASGQPRRGSHESGLNQKSPPSLLSPSSSAGTADSSVYATPMATTPVADGPTKGFAYRKEDVEDTLFAGVAKKHGRRKSRDDRRNSKAKALNHNPEIYAQFGKFTLSPPTSTKDVPNVLAKLQAKQNHFKEMAECKKTGNGLKDQETEDKSAMKTECEAIKEASALPKVNVSAPEDEAEVKDEKAVEEEPFPSLPAPQGAFNFRSSPEKEVAPSSPAITAATVAAALPLIQNPAFPDDAWPKEEEANYEDVEEEGHDGDLTAALASSKDSSSSLAKDLRSVAENAAVVVQEL